MASKLRSIFRTAATALALVSIAVQPAQAAEDELTVFVAKKIVTMDSTNPEATAVAVRGKRIVAVGSMDDLQPPAFLKA